jgi:peptidoglycan/LPS O-acetylase OafA/YrhL
MKTTSGGDFVERLSGIDALRAYAAFSIILFHISFERGIPANEMFSFIRNYLGFGVPLFFTISAFSIAHGYLHKNLSEEVVLRFLLKRWARIAPLFYLVLGYQLLVLWFQYRHFPGIPAIFASLTFSFNFVPRMVDGIVPASWSIGVECVFYALFPLLAVFCRKTVPMLLVAAVTILVSNSAYQDLSKAKEMNESFIYHGWLTCMPYFICGLVGHRFYSFLQRFLAEHPEYLRRMIGIGLTLISLSLILVLVNNSSLYQWFWQRNLRSTWDVLWGAAFLLLCVGIAIHPWSLIANTVTGFLGRISFSLYLLHPHIVQFFSEFRFYAFFATTIRNAPTAIIVCFAATSCVVVLLSVATYHLVELRGITFGKFLEERLASRKFGSRVAQ